MILAHASNLYAKHGVLPSVFFKQRLDLFVQTIMYKPTDQRVIMDTEAIDASGL